MKESKVGGEESVKKENEQLKEELEKLKKQVKELSRKDNSFKDFRVVIAALICLTVCNRRSMSL